MAKAVFTTKIGSRYDDLPEERYHFPKTYLNQARQAVDDFIIYYEPRRRTSDEDDTGGRQVYFAVAHIDGIEEDRNLPDHFYARISGYLNFPHPVPFREGESYFERALVKPDGATSKGAFGRAVRQLPETEFEAICRAGFGGTPFLSLGDEQRPNRGGLQEEQATFERPVSQHLISRRFRDAAFASNIRHAYDSRCSATGIQLLNFDGQPEMHAAHIRPIGGEHKGTDSVRNGIALCRTAHWMFDEGLISISDDYKMLYANREIKGRVSHFFNADDRLVLPHDRSTRPHPKFLTYHRETIFRG